MLAYFGTDVDWGKSAVRVDVDGVMGVSGVLLIDGVQVGPGGNGEGR